MNILISACLLGAHCRYDGGSNERLRLLELCRGHRLIPVCPEQLGGLPTPRSPVEWQGERAVNREGRDCTREFCRGAEETLLLARRLGCNLAILKARSPSCGSRGIYDGTFQGRLVDGMGATARLLAAEGFRVMDEEEAAAYLEALQRGEEPCD